MCGGMALITCVFPPMVCCSTVRESAPAVAKLPVKDPQRFIAPYARNSYSKKNNIEELHSKAMNCKENYTSINTVHTTIQVVYKLYASIHLYTDRNK